MGLIVFWTDSAIEQLDFIFDYYKNKVSLKVAKDIVNKIIDKTIILEDHPTIGQVEEILKNKKHSYRYLVEGNYKIIYWIDEPMVNIATVFDCRQNPIKMKEIN